MKTSTRKSTAATTPLRTGWELVAVKDACEGALNLINAKETTLEAQKAELQSQIKGIDNALRILKADAKALDRELSRVSDEVRTRFDDDWGAAEADGLI